MASTQLLKIEAYHYKLQEKSDEDFQKFVQDVLTPKWVTLVKKHQVVKYTSTITPSAFSEKFRPHLEKTRPGWTMNEANLTLTYYVRDFEQMLKLTADPEYQSRGRDVEKGWIDSSKGHIKVGWETTYVEEGEVVNTTIEE
ncbi:hypothetical protein F4778DRAFT_716734 [Xylariomycetidae sp. FL2044]|nr:hypothetical protein F4778DRAFT_716734 [Xylariomycetidae sp. FL2044]